MGPEVTEVKRYLDGREKRFPCQLVRRDPGHLILRYVSDFSWQVGGLDLPLGMVTHGHYWIDRPYNLYHWMQPGGETIGYYLNVCDQVRLDGPGSEVSWRDLVLDVLLLPTGEARMLDREELPPDLDPALAAYIESAVDEILQSQAGLRREAEEDPDRPERPHRA